MKTLCLFILFAACTVMTTAQVRKIADREVYGSGDWELGISTNTGVSNKKTSGDNYSGYYYYGDMGREFYFSLNAYGGYYLFDGLSIGPELGINLSVGQTLYIIGNLCYTFKTSSRSFFPYIKAGYGVTDVINDPGEKSGLFESLNYSLFNLGVGVKILQSSRLALTIEFNYKNISGSDSRSYYSDPYTETYNTKIEALSFSFGSAIAL